MDLRNHLRAENCKNDKMTSECCDDPFYAPGPTQSMVVRVTQSSSGRRIGLKPFDAAGITTSRRQFAYNGKKAVHLNQTHPGHAPVAINKQAGKGGTVDSHTRPLPQITSMTTSLLDYYPRSQFLLDGSNMPRHIITEPVEEENIFDVDNDSSEEEAQAGTSGQVSYFY